MPRIVDVQQAYFSAGLLLFVVLALFLTTPAVADDEPKSGHSILFSVTESTRVDNDLVAVTFRTVSQAPTADLVMQAINQSMQSAYQALKNDHTLELQTTQYHVNPVYDKHRVITHWQGQQSLTVRTENQAGLPKLLEKIEPFLSYQSMRFYVSEEKQQQAKDQLLDKSLKHYQNKANHIAANFGAKHYQLIETRIDLPNQSMPYTETTMLTARAMSDMAAPVVQAGKSELQVHITGKLFIPH